MNDSEADSDVNADASPPEVRMTTASGRYAIIAIAVLAIGGALFNWTYQRELHRRSLELWGAELARLIVQAPEVEAMRLTPADASDAAPAADEQPAEIISVDGGAWRVVDRVRIETPSQAPGSTHLRRSLVNDKSFDWEAAGDDCQPDWQYAVRFREGDTEQTLVIDLDCPRVALVGGDVRATVTPVVKAWRAFFAEQFPGTARAPLAR